jgi:hypothetical protein
VSTAAPSTPRRAVAGATAAAVAAVGLTAVLIAVSGVDRWPYAIALAAGALALEAMQRSFQSTNTISASDLPLAAGVMVLPPGLAMLSALVVGLMVSGRRPVARLANVAAYALPTALASAVLAGGLAVSGLGGPADAPLAWCAWAAVSMLSLTAANYAFAAGWGWLSYGTSVRSFASEVIGPLAHSEPIRAVLLAAIVTSSLILGGQARLLPVIVAIAATAGMAGYIHSAHKRMETVRQKARLSQAIFLTLARMLEMKDPDTARHSARVAMYSRDVAGRMGLGKEASRIHLAGLLHDIGKVGVSDEILFKPGRLTDEEREVMEDHARMSAEALAGIPGFGDVARMVYAHQESLDGSGYPEGLAGEEIPLGARVIAVADAFEAITSDRPYRRGRSAEEAVAIIREQAGRQFDPAVVEALVALVQAGPVDYRYGSVAHFAEEWAKATSDLDLDPLEEEPFQVPAPPAVRKALAEIAAAETIAEPDRTNAAA